MPGGASLPGLHGARFCPCRPGKAEPPPGESMQTRADRYTKSFALYRGGKGTNPDELTVVSDSGE